jgi:outer membrane protein
MACALSSGAVLAGGMADAIMPEHAPQIIGLGVGVLPDYLGSDDEIVGVAPMARYQFKDSNRYVLLMANELNVNLLNSPSWRAGPVLNYNFGRQDVEDSQVKLMAPVDGALEYGAFVQYVATDTENPRNRWSLGLTGLMKDDAYRMRLGAQYFHQVSKAVDLNLGAGLWYANGDWNNAAFGVNADNVGTSALPFYTVGSGMNQYFANLSAITYLSKNWALAAGVRYARISGDAADSPLVATQGSVNQLIGGIGLTYLGW